MYQELKPSVKQSNLIDAFWTFSTAQFSESFKVFPDTCIDLIVDLSKNEAFVSGIMSNFQIRELASRSNLIGVRFKTESFGCLSKIPTHETKNLRIDFSQLFPNCEQNIVNQLINLESTADKISFLENFIATSFQKNYHRQDKLVLSVAAKIRSLKGCVDGRTIAKSNTISLRQLERRFKSYMGLTIKEFSSIVRFKNAKKMIQSSTETSLLNIAFDTGFFDHAHMNHEFNRISGENPSFFR